MVQSDTSAESHAVQLGVYRRLGSTRRLEIALDMSAAVRELTRAGIRQRHPEYSETDVDSALWRLLWGDALFARACPTRPIKDP